jgi:hypothetical protein
MSAPPASHAASCTHVVRLLCRPGFFPPSRAATNERAWSINARIGTLAAALSTGAPGEISTAPHNTSAGADLGIPRAAVPHAAHSGSHAEAAGNPRSSLGPGRHRAAPDVRRRGVRPAPARAHSRVDLGPMARLSSSEERGGRRPRARAFGARKSLHSSQRKPRTWHPVPRVHCGRP